MTNPRERQGSGGVADRERIDMTQGSNQQAPADDERLRAYVDAVGIHDERLRGYVEAIGLGACDGTDCEDCVGAAKAAMAVADAEQAELRAEVESWKAKYQAEFNRSMTLEKRLDESVPVHTGWRGYDDGSVSPVERWVRASNGDWVSLDSTRRTSRDIIPQHFSSVPDWKGRAEAAEVELARLRAGACSVCAQTPESVVVGSDGTRVCAECHADGEA